MMISLITSIPWSIIIILCLTVGLAPFSPEPHLLEKIRLIFLGQLHSLVDIFDFFFHLSPFVLFIIKTFTSIKK